MNGKALRRLAADHAALHNQPLPPNYLFAPAGASSDELTTLDILLAGPTSTPFEAGVWRLHFEIPNDYPHQPPTAHFRTPIFHPNVEPSTGAVCVETLKRDWDAKLTLRDVLVTISCLLIQPNPDSALNADAGSLIQQDYESFARRARLMTGIHARVSKDLRDAVREAQMRGQEEDGAEEGVEAGEGDIEEPAAKRQSLEAAPQPPPPPIRARRRRVTARQRGTAAAPRRSEGSPSGGPSQRRQPIQLPPRNPFVFQAGNDDIFGFGIPTPHDSFSSEHQQQHEDPAPRTEWDDSTMLDADQENDETRSPGKGRMCTPPVLTPRRPRGEAVPLGELTLDDASDTSIDEDDSFEPEYPPSPRKSPSKSPIKQLRRRGLFDAVDAVHTEPESSAAAALRDRNITPPNVTDTPLAEDSSFAISIQASVSPRKARAGLQTTPGRGAIAKPLFGRRSPRSGRLSGIFKPGAPTSTDEKHRAEMLQKNDFTARLWAACGGDIRRWNRGDFGDGIFEPEAARW